MMLSLTTAGHTLIVAWVDVTNGSLEFDSRWETAMGIIGEYLKAVKYFYLILCVVKLCNVWGKKKKMSQGGFELPASRSRENTTTR